MRDGSGDDANDGSTEKSGSAVEAKVRLPISVRGVSINPGTTMVHHRKEKKNRKDLARGGV